MNQTAQGLAALGRGPDTMLVHMAPEEVAGLQALALKHGGTLTINPETGLAEAGFLKNILPMVVGFALNAFAPGVGTAVGSMFGLGSAAGTALTVGGIAGLTSGSLEKGLMAGLGAYGGAGLAEGFANAGTGALSSGATVDPRAVVPQAPVFEAAVPAATSGASSISAGAAGAIPQTAANPAFSPIQTTTPYPTALSQSAADIGNVYAQEQAAQNAVAKALANKTDLVSAGFDVAKNDPGAFLKKNMMPLAALGIAALSSNDNKGTPGLSSPGMIRPYTYARTKVPGAFDRTPNDPMSSRERQYFNDQYTAQTPYRAPGPEYMAVGGPVEDMSNANAIGMNTGYPQAAIDTGAYANPYQQPISRDMLQPQFAGGGSINLQGTFDMGGGQGGGQMGNLNNPQPFVGSNNAPSMMPQQGVTPLPGLAQGPNRARYLPTDMESIRQSMMNTRGLSLNKTSGLYEKEMFAEGGSVGGYTFDPRTGLYTKPSGEGATTVSPIGSTSGASGSSGGNMQPIDARTAAFFDNETKEARDARMGQVNSVLSQLANFAVPGMGLVSLARDFGLTGIGGIANAFGGTQAPAPVSELGTYAGVPADYAAAQQDSFDRDAANNAQVGASEQSAANEAAGPSGAGTADGGDGYARGGISNLGDYSDGGRLLRGPGDGVSDDIPAMIGQKQQARLADGEFVVPARIVSELGNGSTEAGARQLYAMMDRVQKARKKTVGKDKVATNSRAAKLLPA